MNRIQAGSARASRWSAVGMCVAALFATAAAATVPATLPSLGQEKSRPETTADGTRRLRVPMQDLVAHIGRGGVAVSSVDEGGAAEFSLRVASLRRDGSNAAALREAAVSTSDTLVRVDRGALVEEFSASDLGLRQDFIVPSRPAGRGELRLALALTGARGAVREHGRTVALTLGNGRELRYADLHVTDANGRVLPATFRGVDARRIDIAVDDRGAAYPVRIDPTLADANWTSFGLLGTSGEVFALARNGDDLYLGGSFTFYGLDTPVNRVARWDGSNWFALGAGVASGTVRALLFHAPTNKLFIGGTFGVQIWDGATHTSPGLLPPVFAFAAQGNTVYAGVNQGLGGVIFTTDGGSNWAQLGPAFSGGVEALVMDSASGTLYAGGFFDNVGVPASNVARWNGTAWSALGTGLPDRVSALAWDGKQGRVFAGGAFQGTPPDSPSRVAMWNGTSWSALGDLIPSVGGSEVLALAWDDVDGRLFVGGKSLWPASASQPSPVISLQPGAATWQRSGLGPNEIVRAFDMDRARHRLSAGGRLFSGDENLPGPADNLATYYDGLWHGEYTLGSDGGALKFVRDAARNRLFVAGTFSRVAGVSAMGVAMFDGARWHALGNGVFDTQIADIELDPGSGDVYVAGQTVGLGLDPPSSGVARWNGTAWVGLGSGVFRGRALAWDDVNDVLYVGGSFNNAGGVPADNIAKWNGTSWSALGEGLTGNAGGVMALAWDATTNRLYAGGDFLNSGAAAHNNIAMWNGAAWQPVAKGIATPFASRVAALALDVANQKLYVGGEFSGVTEANDTGVNASNVAMYNIASNSWTALAGGVNGKVNTLAFDPVQKLAVGGQFTRASNGLLQVITNHLAQYDGTTWYALGSGVSGAGSATQVTGLEWDSAQQRLFVGGNYLFGGGKPAAFSYVDYKQLQSITLGALPPGRLRSGRTVTVSATGGASGNPVVFTSLRPDNCTVTGNVVRGTGEGLCVVGVDQAGNATYASAPQKTISISISRFYDGFEDD